MERDRRSEELHRKKRLILTNHDEEREKKPKGTTRKQENSFMAPWVCKTILRAKSLNTREVPTGLGDLFLELRKKSN